tara:strand:- start:794 stop:3334 length:2541 start_codon:yes stop_codon:yes gene_type:complete
MSIVKANGAGESGGFYNGVATQGLRLNDGASQYLSRTPSSAGNRRTFTFSAWIKRAQLDANNVGGGSDTPIISAGTASVFDVLRFVSQNFTTPKDILHVYTYDGSADYSEEVNRSFRDTANWYNIVWAVDTTQSTAGNRIKYYVNGTLQTAVSQYYAQVPQNYDFSFNSTNAHWIGRNLNSTSRYFDGYLAEVNFVDGLQLAADNFGQTKNNIWIAKNPDVSDYGTNGFRLQFKEVGGSANSSGIGADTSGKGNHFTPNNINGIDSNFKDCPENVYCVMNELDKGGNVTLEKGNLSVQSTADDITTSTFHFDVATSKVYAEFYINSSPGLSTAIGITESSVASSISDASGSNAASYWYNANGQTRHTSYANYGNTFAASDIISIRVDEGSLFFYKNGTIQNSGTAAFTSLTGTYSISVGEFSGTNIQIFANFGQDSTFVNTVSQGNNTDANGEGDFKYSVPSGHTALCTKNLANPTIGPDSDTNSDDHHDTVLYTGNGSTQSITGLKFKPDWTWSKDLSAVVNHVLTDSTRGVYKDLFSSSNSVQSNDTAGVTAFNAPSSVGATDGGFNLSSSTNHNVSTNSYASWNWKANGGTTSTDSNGSISSTVQANTTAGFSIINWNGNETNGATIGHGLGAAVEVIWTKCFSHATSWVCGIGGVTGFSTNDYLSLNSSNAKASLTNFYQAYGSSTFTVGVSSADEMNRNTGGVARNYITYCFRSIDGYSKMGFYDGDGSVGPFVFTGFRPALIIIKNTGDANNWQIYDDMRIGVGVTSHTINPVLSAIAPNLATQEFDSQSYPILDLLSNGFRLRLAGTGSTLAQNVNKATGTRYFYMAFAHSPFKFANAF